MSRSFSLRRAARVPGAGVSLLLLLSLLAINGLAVWGILQARESALAAARADLELQATAAARALEAALATLRGDFLFLSQSPPFSLGLDALESPDPVRRRWSRRDAEGALLLFLDAHPAVAHVVVRDAAGAPQVAAGRRQGAPVLLPAGGMEPPPARDALFAAFWPLGVPARGAGTLEARIEAGRLLAAAAPGAADRLALTSAHAADTAGGTGRIEVPVADPRWTPPVRWMLSRSADPDERVRSFEALAGRYRTTVLLNLAVITLALLLGLVAFRQARRAARLQAENENQARVRELERQVLHSERLASVGRLAAGIAHEINNPLEGMANYLSLLEEDLRAGDAGSALALAARVREGVDRAAGITRKVLAFSNPGRGQGTAAPLDLFAVVSGAVGFLRANPAFRRVEIAAVEQEGGEAPVTVLGNPTTLGQLFLNLLLNACQAQPEGGAVEVRVAARDGQALVTVDDRGPGIPPEAAGRLFEPFFSTRGSTGLGLAVCERIAVEHGGRIRAGDRPGGGARFEVELPLAPAPHGPEREAPGGEGALRVAG